MKYNDKEKFIENVLTLNGLRWGSHAIKLQLFKFKLKEKKCEKCGQDDMWCGEYLSLHLEHINGNNRDNRMENLKILCPNCHSQTSTFAGKKNKRGRKKYNISLNKTCDCGQSITNRATMCKDCYHKKSQKVQRPLFIVLVEEINRLGYVETGKKYGVSDNTIRKWFNSNKRVKELKKNMGH